MNLMQAQIAGGAVLAAGTIAGYALARAELWRPPSRFWAAWMLAFSASMAAEGGATLWHNYPLFLMAKGVRTVTLIGLCLSIIAERKRRKALDSL